MWCGTEAARPQQDLVSNSTNEIDGQTDDGGGEDRHRSRQEKEMLNDC